MPIDEEHTFLKEAFELLRWVTNCAHMRGPAGTTAYFISQEKMDEIRSLVRTTDAHI